MSDPRARAGERISDLGDRVGDWWDRTTDTLRDTTQYIVGKVSRDEPEDEPRD